MKRVARVLASGLVVALAAAVAGGGGLRIKIGNGTNREKIVGLWNVKKLAPCFPPAETCEFTKDGKLTLCINLPVTLDFKGGNIKGVFKLTTQGAYEIEGDKLKIILKGGDGKDLVHASAIVKLTGKELETKNEKGAINRFEKK